MALLARIQQSRVAETVPHLCPPQSLSSLDISFSQKNIRFHSDPVEGMEGLLLITRPGGSAVYSNCIVDKKSDL